MLESAEVEDLSHRYEAGTDVCTTITLDLWNTHERMLNNPEMGMLRWACKSTRYDGMLNEDVSTKTQTVLIRIELSAVEV